MPLKKDYNLLILTKSLRVFAYAFISIVLPIYIVRSYATVIFFNIVLDSTIFAGIILALTIFATIPFNLLVTFYTKKIGEKNLLIFLSVMMMLSGLLFAWNPNPWIIILAAILGAISATGTETGPFQSIEQAILSTRTEDRKRTSKFGFYNFAGYVALSLGSLFAGFPDLIPGGTGSLLPLKMMFIVYAGFAVAIGILYFILKDINISTETREHSEATLTLNVNDRKTVAMLSMLFSMDAFGGGFVLQSLLSIWFNTVYHFDLGQLSWIFFISGIITSTSVFLAARIAKRVGLLNTMVFTHLPSNIFLILIPFVPNVFLAVGLLFARQSISQMDVPTRQSYMMAIIAPEDRAPAGAITNISRTAAQGISPSIAASMIASSLYTLPFVFGGGFKIAYDILVYLAFRKVKPPEEKIMEQTHLKV